MRKLCGIKDRSTEEAQKEELYTDNIKGELWNIKGNMI